MNRGEQLHCRIETSIRAQENSSAMEATATPRTEEEVKPGTAKVTVGEVTLRKFELSDVDAMMAWASDPQVAAPCRWDAYESTEPLLAFIRDVVLPHPWFRAICLESGRPVGAVSVSPTGDPCRAELGYVLARAHWGRGVATAAVKRTLATVFAEVQGLERVEALVDVANPASQRVLEKAGFTREAVLRKYAAVKGVVRDMVMFSFIDTDTVPE
jgi:RimJ/RimL family protein N-acetyltransferase